MIDLEHGLMHSAERLALAARASSRCGGIIRAIERQDQATSGKVLGGVSAAGNVCRDFLDEQRRAIGHVTGPKRIVPP
ncbi:hypothetical protein HGG72_23900 [Ochrobactrum pecoris]|nr:hypothetical protein [Brucella pecoris]